ncbi:MAG: cbb3-type cytochrome c oxidase subunit I [Burkholderiales bacterium]|nr:cbb3-type cytochrome c oxidase subunit I [Burkholderiales bacterium]
MKRASSLTLPLPAASAASLPAARYRLAVPADVRRKLARAWLLLGIAAIALSGVFSLLLVLSRTPGVNALFPVADFFRVALVVHVDLSVLVWFAAFAGVFWSLAGARQVPALAWLGVALATAGTLIMSGAPFVQNAAPIMANYIPVLDGAVFLTGLLLLGIGIGVMVLRGLLTAPVVTGALDGAAALRVGLAAAALCTALALFAFVWSWRALPPGLDARTAYEVLFWGGGHVLQFTWTLLLLVAWLWLADAGGARLPLSPRVVVLLFTLAMLPVLATPLVYLTYDVTSVEHRHALTWMMRAGGGFGILPLALAVVIALLRAPAPAPAARPLRAALLWSLVLFGAGGVIGFAIQGADVRIPAHYHGCIVGVTLAFMGVTYELLPRLGWQAPQLRLAAWQPAVYGIGQLLHIGGLVWSGGYGVQRKVAGSEQILTRLEQIAGMGLMGLGGLIAIVGGMLFVLVVIGALRTPRIERSIHKGSLMA